jgi:hypothetical protein
VGLSTAVFLLDMWVVFTVEFLVIDSSFHRRGITSLSFRLHVMILLILETVHKIKQQMLVIQKTQLYYIIKYIYTADDGNCWPTTCFGPVYWPSSGCIINLISNYTIYAWVLWGTRSRLKVVGGMAFGSSWIGVNIICQCLIVLFQTCWELD